MSSWLLAFLTSSQVPLTSVLTVCNTIRLYQHSNIFLLTLTIWSDKYENSQSQQEMLVALRKLFKIL